jgi:hypothetical protein
MFIDSRYAAPSASTFDAEIAADLHHETELGREQGDAPGVRRAVRGVSDGDSARSAETSSPRRPHGFMAHAVVRRFSATPPICQEKKCVCRGGASVTMFAGEK